MKKLVLLMLSIMNLSCSGDDNNLSPADPVVGKWIIYRAEYENTVYEYEINNNCGQESVEMTTSFIYNPLIETFYSNADCTGFTATGDWVWVNDGNSEYSVYRIGETVPERNLTLLDNKLKVTTRGNITVIKYYKPANE